MAFDRPLEADRIDDFNLFSAFVRAPLWILGGVLGGGNRQSHLHDEDDELDAALPRIVNQPPQHQENIPPLDSILREDSCGQATLATVPSDDDFASASAFDPSTADMKRKNLSWSDESGKNLVEYNDESVRHEPSPYSLSTTTSAPKPVKSALRRSESIKNDADTLSQLPDRTRYIPKMTAAKTSLILPTRPYGDASRDGVESPQLGYGFYMNLTPPTPEMYHPSYSKMQQQLHPRSNLGSLPIRSQQNHVFQSLQNKNAQQMGWTSVPI